MPISADRVEEACASAPNTGSCTLNGATYGNRSFAEAGLSGGTIAVWYMIYEDAFAKWEAGYGTCTGTTFARTSVVINHLGTTATIDFTDNDPPIRVAIIMWTDNDELTDTNNLSDVDTVSVCRTNLGLKSTALQNVYLALDAAIWYDASVGYTNQTTAASNATVNDMTLMHATEPAVGDCYYFGHATQFTRMTLAISTPGVGSWAYTWEYWNGSWTTLSATDYTKQYGQSFKQTGDVTWSAPGDWATTTVNSQGPYYYVRARLSTYTSKTQHPIGARAWRAAALNADLLDGTHASAYVQTTGAQTGIAGEKTFADDISVGNSASDSLTVKGRLNANADSGSVVRIPVGANKWAT